jgi:hypothetical protein
MWKSRRKEMGRKGDGRKRERETGRKGDGKNGRPRERK